MWRQATHRSQGAVRDLSSLKPAPCARWLEQKVMRFKMRRPKRPKRRSCTGPLKSAIRRDQTTIRKNRGVTFVGRLSLAAGDKNDTRGTTSMRYAVVALEEGGLSAK